ncbi:MAG TPA: glycoside hydrolase family 2 TIM barrel-domain containing protein [Acidimicrobiia bacterium]|nr:glycoside hydrolase family 2 TIM barrel-domain containing protein [Acidimicrobiia bacterium]
MDEAERPSVDLGGSWLVHPATGDLPKEFSSPDLDDSGWTRARVPGHWRHAAGLGEHDGPVLYRRRFTCPDAPASTRRFLELDGVFYYGDVWLDGSYVGATEGYFAPHAFDVSDALRDGGDHVLAIEVASPRTSDPTAKRTITGIFGHWDNLDADWNPGGIWRDLRIAASGAVRIDRLRVLCTEATAERGRILVDVTLDAPDDPPAVAALSIEVVGPDGEPIAHDDREVPLSRGTNGIVCTVPVEAPPRWWPREHGTQPLCTVVVTASVDGAPSDRRTRRTAFRDVRRDGDVLVVNGERMFLKGTNLAPTRAALGDATADELARDITLAADANLDFVRVHGHVTRPELYDAADEQGMLVWQDFPLQWGYARSVRKQAVRQARAMVDLLGHHPSIVQWCAHNEPFAIDRAPGTPISRRAAARLAAGFALPSWNKDVLDRSVARSLHRADPSRPVLRHSGTVTTLDHTGDSHVYFGWYHGEMTDLAPALRAAPRLATFVSEFGAQAVPSTSAWMQPERYPDLDWETLSHNHLLQRSRLERYVPVDECKTFEEWTDATQAYQAALLQLQIEDLRRLKYRPTAGFAQFCLADSHPAVSWSVLDHERVPKRGYHALRDACRPVLPMVEPREGLVHVANDRHRPLLGAVVVVEVDDHRRAFTGDIAADAVTYVGQVALGDAVDVRVRLEHPDVGTVEQGYPLSVLDIVRRTR